MAGQTLSKARPADGDTEVSISKSSANHKLESRAPSKQPFAASEQVQSATKRQSRNDARSPQEPPAPRDNVTATVQQRPEVVAAGQVRVSAAKALDIAARSVRARQFARAERVSRQVIAVNPDLAQAHNILGVALGAQGKRSSAISALRAAAKLAPANIDIRINLGEVLRQSGDLHEAAMVLQKVLSSHADNVMALNNLGLVYIKLGQYDGAITCLRKAVRLKPDFAQAQASLASALHKAGKLEEAILSYQQCVKLLMSAQS